MAQDEDSEKEFEFYLNFAKPLVLCVTDPSERALAASWIQRLKSNTEEDPPELRNDYLKLLLLSLQRKKLLGPFANPPDKNKPLEPFPENCSVFEMGLQLVENDDKSKGDQEVYPQYEVEVSSDMMEYAAAQKIQNFGIHAFYAVSNEPISSWFNSKNAHLPANLEETKRAQITCGSPQERMNDLWWDPEESMKAARQAKQSQWEEGEYIVSEYPFRGSSKTANSIRKIDDKNDVQHALIKSSRGAYEMEYNRQYASFALGAEQQMSNQPSLLNKSYLLRKKGVKRTVTAAPVNQDDLGIDYSKQYAKGVDILSTSKNQPAGQVTVTKKFFYSVDDARKILDRYKKNYSSIENSCSEQEPLTFPQLNLNKTVTETDSHKIHNISISRRR